MMKDWCIHYTDEEAIRAFADIDSNHSGGRLRGGLGTAGPLGTVHLGGRRGRILSRCSTLLAAWQREVTLIHGPPLASLASGISLDEFRTWFKNEGHGYSKKNTLLMLRKKMKGNDSSLESQARGAYMYICMRATHGQRTAQNMVSSQN